MARAAGMVVPRVRRRLMAPMAGKRVSVSFIVAVVVVEKGSVKLCRVVR